MEDHHDPFDEMSRAEELALATAAVKTLNSVALYAVSVVGPDVSSWPIAEQLSPSLAALRMTLKLESTKPVAVLEQRPNFACFARHVGSISYNQKHVTTVLTLINS